MHIEARETETNTKIDRVTGTDPNEMKENDTKRERMEKSNRNKETVKPGPASAFGRASAYKLSNLRSIQQRNISFAPWQLKMCDLDLFETFI